MTRRNLFSAVAATFATAVANCFGNTKHDLLPLKGISIGCVHKGTNGVTFGVAIPLTDTMPADSNWNNHREVRLSGKEVKQLAEHLRLLGEAHDRSVAKWGLQE